MDYKKIGDFIARKRREKNLTQNELAEILGLTDRAISRWERGVGCPDISLLEKLSNELGVTVLELLHGEEIINNQNDVLVHILKNDHKINFRWKLVSYIFLNLLLVFFVFLLIVVYYIPKRISNDGVNSSYNSHYATVVSKSMMPQFNVYDLLYVRSTKIDKIKVGDVISYYNVGSSIGDTPITHRVVEINKENNCLITKGDANYEVDFGCVDQNHLLGKVKLRMPYIGRFVVGNSKVSISFVFFIFLGILSIILLDFLQIKKIVIK